MFNYTIFILISAYVQSQSIFGGERSLAVVLRPVHRGVKMDLDEVDRKIILALIEEPKASLRTLASEVGIALGTASVRLKSLQEKGIIRGWSVDLDPQAIGWEMCVIVGLRIEKGKMMDVQQRIASDSRVFSVYDVTGDFDSIVMARIRNRQELNDLTKEVFSIDGINRSFTHVVMNTVKESTVTPPFE